MTSLDILSGVYYSSFSTPLERRNMSSNSGRRPTSLFTILKHSYLIGFAVCYCLIAHAQQEKPPEFSVHVPVKSEELISKFYDDQTQELDYSGLSISFADQHQKYLNSIRYGSGDFFIVEPHFALWLNREHNFLPVAQISVADTLLLVTQKQDISIFDYTDLIRKPVCNRMPLDAGFLMLNRLYAKLPSAPIIDNGHNILAITQHQDVSGCRGFVISQTLFQSLEADIQSKFETLHSSDKKNYLLVMASLDALTRITDNNTKLINSPVIQSLRQLSKNITRQLGQRQAWLQPDRQKLDQASSEILDNYWLKD